MSPPARPGGPPPAGRRRRPRARSWDGQEQNDIEHRGEAYPVVASGARLLNRLVWRSRAQLWRAGDPAATAYAQVFRFVGQSRRARAPHSFRATQTKRPCRISRWACSETGPMRSDHLDLTRRLPARCGRLATRKTWVSTASRLAENGVETHLPVVTGCRASSSRLVGASRRHAARRSRAIARITFLALFDKARWS